MRFGPFEFDAFLGVLRRDGRDVALPGKAQDLLRCLLERPGSVVSKDEMVAIVWNDAAVTDHSVTEAIHGLRKVLGDDARRPRYIQTVHRHGYRFVAHVTILDNGLTDLADGAEVGARRDRQALTGHGSRLWTGTALAVLATATLWLIADVSFPGITGRDPLAGLEDPMTIGPPPDRSFDPQSHAVAITPDGSTLIFPATAPGDPYHLYTHRLGEAVSRPLYQTVGDWVLSPFVSSDGRVVGYVSGLDDQGASPPGRRSIHAVDLENGGSHLLCTGCAGNIAGATFAADGTLIFSQFVGEALETRVLWRLSPGERPEPLDVQPPEPGAGYLWPRLLPGDKWLLVTVRYGRTIEGARVAALNLDTGQRRTLIAEGFNAHYVPTPGQPEQGHLLFGRSGELWAVAFDVERMEVLGEPVAVPLDKPVAMNADTGSAGFAVSNTGTFVYYPGVFWRRTFGLFVRGRNGGGHWLVDDRAQYRSARVSPDQTRLAVCVRAKRDEIRIYDLLGRGDERSARFQFTLRHSVRDQCAPVWSTDSRSIAFASGGDLWTVEARKDRTPALLVHTDTWIEPVDWSADGEVVYTMRTATGDRDVWAVDARCRDTKPWLDACASEHRRPLLATPEDERAGRLSPDGRWLTVQLGAASTIHAVPFPGGGQGIQVGEGLWPRWAPDGALLYYFDRRRWMAAPWRPGIDDPGPSARPQTGLPAGSFEEMLADGAVVGITSSSPALPTTEILVVPGFSAMLRRLAPAGQATASLPRSR